MIESWLDLAIDETNDDVVDSLINAPGLLSTLYKTGELEGVGGYTMLWVDSRNQQGIAFIEKLMGLVERETEVLPDGVLHDRQHGVYVCFGKHVGQRRTLLCGVHIMAKQGREKICQAGLATLLQHAPEKEPA
jgi:hypothetical protein